MVRRLIKEGFHNGHQVPDDRHFKSKITAPKDTEDARSVSEAPKPAQCRPQWNAAIEEGSGIEVGSGMPAVPVATFAQAAE
jgi:hypothetical protein